MNGFHVPTPIDIPDVLNSIKMSHNKNDKIARPDEKQQNCSQFGVQLPKKKDNWLGLIGI